MKKFKLTLWGSGLVGFFSGLIIMFILMLSFTSDYKPVGDPTDITDREFAMILIPILVLFIFGLSLLVSAWRNRKNRKSMIKYLVPGLIITLFLFISMFGGVVLAPFT